MVYLTSRPIVLAPKTRAFLTSTKQDGMPLPLGPLRCCLDNVTGVLWREVFVFFVRAAFRIPIQSLCLLLARSDMQSKQHSRRGVS